MRFIKLFEAFESEKLSKTLRFITDTSQFKNILRMIGDKLDFPISLFEDSMFEYLPYYQAVKKNAVKKNVEVKLDEFGKSKIQLIKFWFTKDGGFIGITGNDGSPAKLEKSMSFSRNLDDYEIGERLTLRELLKLNSGDKVLFRPTDYDEPVVGVVWSEGSSVFILQDSYSGTTPSKIGWKDREKIAKYSWIISRESDFGQINILSPKNKEADKISNRRMDLYDWSLGVEYDLNDADFAIILDLNKVEGLKSLSNIRSERDIRKSGAFMSDDEIRNLNLDKYFSKLAGRFDFENSFGSLSSVINRSLGQNYALFFIVKRHNLSELEDLISLLYDMIRYPSEHSKNDILEKIKNLYYGGLKNKQMMKIVDMAKKDSDFTEKHLEILDSILEISQKLSQKISSQKIENISDIEVLMEKIYLLQRFLEGSRLPDINRFRSISRQLETGVNSLYSDIDYCVEIGEEFFETIKGVDRAVDKIF
jgi:hypothetical protein